jgi:hypothetical protein
MARPSTNRIKRIINLSNITVVFQDYSGTPSLKGYLHSERTMIVANSGMMLDNVQTPPDILLSSHVT